MGAVTALASVGTGKMKIAGETQVKASGYQLGAQYAFSKRTSAYAYTGRTSLKDPADNDKLKFNTYSVGLRHNF